MLLPLLLDVLTKDVQHSLIMADYLEENFEGNLELPMYLKRLRQPNKLRLATLIDVVSKYGTKEERWAIVKVMRDHRHLFEHCSKGAVRSWLNHRRLHVKSTAFLEVLSKYT